MILLSKDERTSKIDTSNIKYVKIYRFVYVSVGVMPTVFFFFSETV